MLERRQQDVGDVLRLGQQHRLSGGEVPGQQAADHPDVRLEDLHRLGDRVEVQVVADPRDAHGHLVVQAHEEQRVQRLDDGQAHRVGVVEELAEPAGDRHQLVMPPGELLVGVPGVQHLVAHVRRRGRPATGWHLAVEVGVVARGGRRGTGGREPHADRRGTGHRAAEQCATA